METVYRDASSPETMESELSPVELFRHRWRQQPGALSFLRQKSMIDQHSDLLPYANVVSPRDWKSPMVFACEGLVVAALLLGLINWYETHDRGPLQDEIVALQANVQAEAQRQKGVMDAAQAEARKIRASSKAVVWKNVAREDALQQLESAQVDAQQSLEQYKKRMAERESELRSRLRADTLARSGTPLVFSLALVLGAGLVASGVKRDYPRNNVRAAGDYYLYFATATGLWSNLIFLVFLHFALSGRSYGMAQLSDTAGPLFWMLFWIGFSVLLLRYFAGVAREMYKVMQIRMPGSEWSPENRVLLRISTSILLMFVGLEAVFLGVSYVVYLASQRFA
jgi:hypothetical protein